jgi:hypothetical protein
LRCHFHGPCSLSTTAAPPTLNLHLLCLHLGAFSFTTHYLPQCPAWIVVGGRVISCPPLSYNIYYPQLSAAKLDRMADTSASPPVAAHLVADQVDAIVICTRTMSVLSLLGSCYIISTFMFFRFFRKPINRLVFYATWGNIMANIATLISASGIPNDPDQLSPLCEFQGVLIQWFMMADSLWVFCMATNVFLVFWRGYDAQQLRYLEKWYLLFAYGVPAIPPIVYVIMDHHGSRRVIGPATLWCWIAKDVDWMRIAFFYGPVWIVVSATMTIYIATGIKIIRKGSLLRFFMDESQQTSHYRDSTMVEETVVNPFAAGKNIIVTTQIQHDVHPQSLDSRCVSYEGDQRSLSSFSSTKDLSSANHQEETEAAPSGELRISRVSRDLKTSTDMRNGLCQREDDAKSGYRATAFATKHIEESAPLPPRPSSAATHHRNSHIKRAAGNEAALAYLKVAFLMFIALFVVWVPSTVNRLFQFIHKDRPSFALNVLSAIVLPLQGAWNATIYIYTTRSECRRAYSLIRLKLSGKAIPYHPPQDLFSKDTLTSTQGMRDYDPEIQLEEGLEQGDHLRHNTLANTDCMVESKPVRI